jgi:hypothetical protein
MQAGPVRILIFFTFSILFICSVAEAQSNHGRPGGQGQGALTITVTVVPSVWVDMGPGKQEVVVANSSADSKETFSHAVGQPKNETLPMLSTKKTPASAQKSVSKDVPQAQQPENENKSDAVLQFSLPSPNKFEVRKEIIVMEVSEGGKTRRAPVTVTTVVPQ